MMAEVNFGHDFFVQGSFCCFGFILNEADRKIKSWQVIHYLIHSLMKPY